MQRLHSPFPFRAFIAPLEQANHSALCIGTDRAAELAALHIDSSLICAITPIDLLTEEDRANAALIIAIPHLMSGMESINNFIKMYKENFITKDQMIEYVTEVTTSTVLKALTPIELEVSTGEKINLTEQ